MTLSLVDHQIKSKAFSIPLVVLNLLVSITIQIPISYWLNDGYRFQDTSDFDTYHTLIGEGVSEYSTPVKTDFSECYYV